MQELVYKLERVYEGQSEREKLLFRSAEKVREILIARKVTPTVIITTSTVMTIHTTITITGMSNIVIITLTIISRQIIRMITYIHTRLATHMITSIHMAMTLMASTFTLTDII